MNPRATIGVVCALALVAGAAAQSPAQPAARPPAGPGKRIVLDRQLHRRVVEILRIDAKSLLGADEAGSVVVPREDLLAILPEAWELPVLTVPVERDPEAPNPAEEEDPPLALVVRTSGVAYRGHFDGVERGGEAIAWANAEIGRVVLPLDSLTRVFLKQLDPGVRPPAAAEGAEKDRVILVNGDVLAGFIESLKTAGGAIQVAIEQSGKPHQIRIDRVSEMTFGNPPAPMPAAMAWTDNGTAFEFKDMVSTDDVAAPGVRFTFPGDAGATGSVEVPMPNVRAAVFATARLRGLAGLGARRQEPLGERQWSPKIQVDIAGGAALGLGDLTLPGPMLVEWALPKTARRLGARAELPPTCRVWGDCVLIVEQIDGGAPRELLRQRINGEHPVFEVNVELRAPAGSNETTLRLSLDPGERGPIQDRIVLRTPVLLLEPPK